MKGLVLSGGSGSRLRPLTHTGPKQLIPVANKPVLQYVIEDLREAGITDIGVILGNNGKEQVIAELKDGRQYGVSITYVEQGAPLGIAHAVQCAREFIGNDNFIVYLGDNMLKDGVKGLVDEFMQGGYDAAISLQAVPNPRQFGVAELDEGGHVVGLEEKPKVPKSNYALVGVYLFTPVIFEMIKQIKPSWRNELEITDAIQKLLDNHHKVRSHVVTGWWKDTGKPEDILDVNRLVLDELKPVVRGSIEPGASVSGRVSLGENSVIRAGCVVRGPVAIGDNCTVEEGSYIGPYTSVGNDCVVRNAYVESSVLMGGCRVECDNRIVDSLIGKNATILSANHEVPRGSRLVVGENSYLKI
jgi:glucose-1-phosphate thymidylyltransferase